MKLLGAAKENMGIVTGGVAGVFLGAMAVNAVSGAAQSVLGASGAKWAGVAGGAVVAVASFYAAGKVKGPKMSTAFVTFGAVALGMAIQSGLSAFQTSSA
jgi:hypothetical protein